MASRRKPPVHRRTQKTTLRALERKVVALEAQATRLPTRTVTLASIANLRKSGANMVGKVTRQGSNEFGASGTLNVFGRIYNEDYNALFDGKNGITIYDQMYRSDGTLGAATDIITFPIRQSRFRAIPPEPNATPKEKQIADALNAALFDNGNWPDGESWDFYLRHLCLRVPFGVGALEKVWWFNEDEGVLQWSRLAPRLPRTIDQFKVDTTGRLEALIQYAPDPSTGNQGYKTIPAEYLCLSVREREGDNYYGKSIYRRIYKHWYYKDDAYRIDGMRLDRYGVGVPVAKIEENYVLEADELNEIEMTLMALRSHERAYIIEPAGVTFRIMVPEGGHGGALGLMESVKHHDEQMLRAVMATFMGDHVEGLNTNRTKTLADIFLHALRAEAMSIGADIRSQLFRPFCKFNFDMSDARVPVCEVTGIGDLTVEQFAQAVPTLVTAGLLTVDDSMEDFCRKLFGFQPMPIGLKRGDKKPAAPTAGVNPENDPDNPEGGGDPNEDEDVIDSDKDRRELALSLRTMAKKIDKPKRVKPKKKKQKAA